MIIFGWGRRTFHDEGAVTYQRCPHCSNSNWFYLVTVRRWLTLFFIPLIPYERQHMLICPVCNRGVRLAGAELKRARSMSQLAALYTANAINGPEYMRRLQEAGIPAAAGASPAPLSFAATPPASDGFGGIQVAAQSAAPPMPSTTPAFRGTKMGRTAQATRVLVPIIAIAAVATLWVVTSRNTGTANTTGATVSSFQVGDCITAPSSAGEIFSVSCSVAHNGRIDSVLSGGATFCPPADSEVAMLPPTPNLCVNFTDHTP